MDEANVTTVALAEQLRERGWKPTQSLVSKWRQGHQRPHDIDIYPDIEDICGVRRGTIFRRAGYVEDVDRSDVRAVIDTDDQLTPEMRQSLKLTYEGYIGLRRLSAESGPGSAGGGGEAAGVPLHRR